jgi:3-methyladenine DNA glycosylase AlkD
MPTTTKRPTKTAAKSVKPAAARDVKADVASILAQLERLGTKAGREGMQRYGIVAPKMFGVSVSQMQQMSKQFGRDHDLAAALWETGWYEARMMAGFLDEPTRVTPAQMDRWAGDFDNWAVCDHLCFHLFDRTPHAFAKIRQWSTKRGEFQKRAAFALLASVALHDRKTPDEEFLPCLALIENASTDDRNFVKKSLVWALRLLGERSQALNAATLDLVRRLAESDDRTARSIGKEVIRELAKPAAAKRLASRTRTTKKA